MSRSNFAKRDTPITKTNAVEVNPVPDDGNGEPHPDWVRGTCPECGGKLVSSMYYVDGKGYLLAWECWRSRGENPPCNYRRVL